MGKPRTSDAVFLESHTKFSQNFVMVVPAIHKHIETSFQPFHAVVHCCHSFSEYMDPERSFVENGVFFC